MMAKSSSFNFKDIKVCTESSWVGYFAIQISVPNINVKMPPSIQATRIVEKIVIHVHTAISCNDVQRACFNVRNKWNILTGASCLRRLAIAAVSCMFNSLILGLVSSCRIVNRRLPLRFILNHTPWLYVMPCNRRCKRKGGNLCRRK